MNNITYLVSDDLLTKELLLIGLPVLRHLKIDTKTMLEKNREILDGVDCSEVGNPTVSDGGGYVSRVMTARAERLIESGPVSTETEATVPDPNRPRANYYVLAEDDTLPNPALLDPVDSDQHADIVTAVSKMLYQSKENGLPNEHFSRMKTIVYEHLDIFRTGLSSGPAADLPPLKIELTNEALPVRVRLRNYSQPQKEFLHDFTSRLVSKDMAYPNPKSKWAAAPLCVPKSGPQMFRFTADLRGANKFTLKHAYPMPLLENELRKLAGSQCYANLDLFNAYWQLSLHEDSQEIQSFVTPDGVLTPTRVMHGTTNAVAHLQACLTTLLGENNLTRALLIWLDDLLAYGTSITKLMDAIETFFSLCRLRRIRLDPRKCILYSTLIRWCGRLISPSGIKFDPRNLQALLKMEPPKTGAHLQQFCCALQWVRTSIPNFSALIKPLVDFLECVYKKARKRTRAAAGRVSMQSLGWGETEHAAFLDCRTALANQVMLNHRDLSKRLCVYTDASDDIWSAIVTQIPQADVHLSHEKQRHEPLAFLSGRFNKTKFGWSILEKEAYAILASCIRMHWLLAVPEGFDLFTDHNNIIFIFDLLSLIPDLAISSVRKVLRWAVGISMYNYVVHHIRGHDNVWADLQGRWSAPPTVRRLIHIPSLVSSGEDEFDWPKEDELACSQAKHAVVRPKDLSYVSGLWCNTTGALWILQECTDLQLRVCIIAHTGPGGHRGQKATERIIRRHYFWNSMAIDVQTFFRKCIHCLSTTGGVRQPRPFGPALHGSMPNDLIQFDFLEMAPSDAGYKYLLMIRDDFSSYVWLFPFENANAENSSTAILEWATTFTIPKGLMSDGGSHFQNETVRLVARGLRSPHHFTLPYTPWSNGGIERVCKEVLRIFRATLSELKMQPREWPDLVPMLQSALNNAPSPQRANIAPVKIFTGLDPSDPVQTFRRASTGTIVTLETAKSEIRTNISKLGSLISEIHPLVQVTLDRNLRRARESASRGELARFTVGDFVLVARGTFFKGEKLALRWRGPRRIVKAKSDFVYSVEDLRNGSQEDIHACRLRFYSDAAAIIPHVIVSGTGMPSPDAWV